MRRLIAALLLVTALNGATTTIPAIASTKVFVPARCVVETKASGFAHCELRRHGKYSVAIIGDSHARSWLQPMLRLSEKHNWTLTLISKSACPVLDTANPPSSLPSDTCLQWNNSLAKYLATRPHFDLVVNSTSSLVNHGYRSFSKSFAIAAKRIVATGAQLLVIRDNPKPASGFRACIREHLKTAATDCARLRTDALTPNDPMPAAVSGLHGVKVVDFTDAFCGPKLCSPLIDGIVVYKDFSHMSTDWALHLTPKLEAVIPAKFKG
jgi:hypothetical protein